MAQNFPMSNLSDWESGVGTLIELFASEDKYVRHSSKRVLSLLGNYLESSTWAWTTLVERLWDAVKVWLSGSAMSAHHAFCPSASSMLTDEFTNSGEMVKGNECSQSGTPVRSVSWTATTGMLELLRYLLKNVVGKDECIAAFHRVLLRQIARVDCCHLNEEEPSSRVCVCLSTDGGLYGAGTVSDLIRRCMTADCSHSEELKDRELLLGSWLQLLSSVMRSLNLQKSQCLAEDNKLQYISVKHIELLIPSLSDLALSPQQHPCGKHSIRYFLRHKLLTLMLKFADWFAVDQTVSTTCMTALRLNAGDILRTSVLEHDEIDISESCSSSPFSTCVAESSGVDNRLRSLGYLHRRSLLLFFKAVSLGSRKADLQISQVPACLEVSPREHEEGNTKEWVADLKCWLEDQLQAARNESKGMESSSSINRLCISLLELFAEEDDLLVEMLLQLMNIASLLKHCRVEPVTQETASAVSAISPLRLYLAFLALINYDESVMMDFLLSKQTGPLCLQYVMRSLSLIHETWPQVLEYASPVAVQTHSSSQESYSTEQLNSMVLSLQGAGTCMSKLKCSIQRLHEKQLFPYNPTPLVNRLQGFEELMSKPQTDST